jgi:hypothetical protein
MIDAPPEVCIDCGKTKWARYPADEGGSRIHEKSGTTGWGAGHHPFRLEGDR